MPVQSIRCPICRKKVARDDPNMPFCSDRCRLIDLGNWAAEKYVISTPSVSNDLEDEEPWDETPPGRPQ